MTDLSQYEEITDVTFDHNGAHLAVCHKDQGGSANLKHESLLLKGYLSVNNAVIKSLEGVYDKEKIIKLSNRNLRNLLESALEAAYRAASPYSDYCYIWVSDFDDSTVIYEYKDTKYAVMFEQGENGIELQGNIQEAIEHTIYLSSDGKELLLKHAGKINSDVASATEDNPSEDITKTNNPKDTKMSDATVQSKEELDVLIQKAVEAATAGQAEAIIKAQEEARAEIKAEIAQVELQKASEAVVKSFDFIAQDNQVEVVKAIMLQEDGGVSIVKAFESAQAVIKQLNKDKDDIKKEFGEARHSEDSGEVIEKSLAETLAEKIQKSKAAKANK